MKDTKECLQTVVYMNYQGNVNVNAHAKTLRNVIGYVVIACAYFIITQ